MESSSAAVELSAAPPQSRGGKQLHAGAAMLCSASSHRADAGPATSRPGGPDTIWRLPLISLHWRLGSITFYGG